MRRPHLPGRPWMIAILAALVVALPSSALALQAARQPAPGAQQRLTADTAAGCNTAQRAGFARCFAVVRTAARGRIAASASGPPSTALGPADIQSAYKLPSAGGGKTIAVVDAFGDSSAESDLASFRSHYGLPACTTANGCFRKVNQTGGTTYPADDAGWAVETSLDLDAVSSACPACNILLVEADDNSFANLGAAVNKAVSMGARYVSNSYGSPTEDSSELTFDHFYDHPGVVVAAAAGDAGNVTSWPATNPDVVSVGGTTLARDTTAARGWDETAWASGGSGCSPVEPHPDYQDGIATGCPANRAIGDIAADADPASGLAIFDTVGEGGWLQVGGTSLATPLITSMYALAGTPQPGSNPVTYPYHDPSQAKDLFDITQGSDGSCGDVLCTAGPGWDGPTGLGTPDGVGALTSGPQGEITGKLTNAATGAPIAGATVSASPGSYVTRTGSDGTYRLDTQAGKYDLTASDFGFKTTTASGVQVAANKTVTANFALRSVPSSTLAGAVRGASGHRWPLYASITISGFPNGAVYTSPVTGKYKVVLPQGSYTLTVDSAYPGYQPVTRQVTVGRSNVTDNITMSADLTACTAPGYGLNGHLTDFTGARAATPGADWTVSGSRAGWRFDNPGNRPPPQTPPLFASGGSGSFAVADSGASGGPMDTTLTSPAIRLAAGAVPGLEFDTAYYAAPRQAAEVQLTVNGGKSWSTVWHQAAADAIGHVSIPLPSAAGKDARIRFRFTGNDGWYWAVDNVFVGSHACVAQPGGLLVGVVSGKTAGAPVDGARISTSSDHEAPAWPGGLAQATADPALPGGFYWLFCPPGSQRLTVRAAGFTTSTASVRVPAGAITRRNFALTGNGS